MKGDEGGGLKRSPGKREKLKEEPDVQNGQGFQDNGADYPGFDFKAVKAGNNPADRNAELDLQGVGQLL